MTAFLPTPPEHPQLGDSRILQLADHLAYELRGEQFAHRRLARRQLVLVAAAVAVLLTLVGAGYAVGTQALDVFDLSGDPSGPARIGNRVEIANVDDYSLYAWKSTWGICLGVAQDDKPEASGCGMPVVGAPPDQVFRQPEPTHVVGYMAGGAADDPFWVTGPVAQNVHRVEVELVNGGVLEGQVYEPPPGLDVNVGFYFVLDDALSGTTFPTDRHPVRVLRAYDADGALLERFQVPAPG